MVFGAILFPLWPPILRTAVWYLSIALLGFIVAIAIIAVIRLILFIITMFALSPGIWLFPNLFEDVGFFESFVPLWAWQKVPKPKKKKGISNAATAVTGGGGGGGGGGAGAGGGGGGDEKREEQKNLNTTVEDASDEE